MCNVDCHTLAEDCAPGRTVAKVLWPGVLSNRPPSCPPIRSYGLPCDSIGVSLVMTALGQEKRATFIGQWGTALKACKAIRRILLRNQRA
jgi:hypothetical protein